MRFRKFFTTLQKTPKAMKQSEFTDLINFNNYGEATIYKSLLESNGIDCQLFDTLMSGILPMAGDSVMIRLVVPTEQAELAREILAAGFQKEDHE